MECLINCRSELSLPPGYEGIITTVAEQTLEECGCKEVCSQWEVTVSVVDNPEIRELNKRFRNIDKETDVLSFPLMCFTDDEAAGGLSKKCIINTDMALTYELGDIIISVPKLIAQAEEYGHSPERELGFLTAHGMLHLLGFDHETPDDEQTMRSLQTKIMNACKLTL